jgi:UPF0042 nucleotide-binding protein
MMVAPMDRFVVVTGLSGAGKTTALHAFEEFGYFTLDNAPPALWPEALRLCLERGLRRVAVVTDARTRHFLGGLHAALEAVSATIAPEVLYLDAADEVLIRRYGLTRRTHPLHEATLMADLREERRVLEPFREVADVVIDSTDLSPRALVSRLRELYGEGQTGTLRLFSFGFKHGAPRDADLVLDVRGLPNPYYDPALEPLSGLDPAVRDYVFTADATAFYQQLKDFVQTSVGLAMRAGRTAYTVAVGCTGGRHRSVAVVESLARDLATAWPIGVEHRDLEKGEGGP